MYHRLGEAYPDTTPSFFDWQLETIKQHSSFLNPNDVLQEIPKDGTLLTFDDGHRSHLETVIPRLNDHGIKGLFFITVDYMQNREDYLDETQIRSIAEDGHRIGSHGISHDKLTNISPQKARQELLDSRKKLQDLTGQSVHHVAYPHGAYDNEIIEMAKSSGYLAGFTIGDRFLESVDDNLEIPRLWIHNGLTRKAFKGKLTKALTWYNALRMS